MDMTNISYVTADSVYIRWFLFKMLWLAFTSLIIEIERGGMAADFGLPCVADHNPKDRKLIKKKSHAAGQLHFQEEGKHNFFKTVSTGHCLNDAV